MKRKVKKQSAGEAFAAASKGDATTAAAIERTQARLRDFGRKLVEAIRLHDQLLAADFTPPETDADFERLGKMIELDRPHFKTVEHSQHDILQFALAWHDLKLREAKISPPRTAKIPPESRTSPMTLGEAARHMGYTGDQRNKAKRLKQHLIDNGSRFERINRQTYVLDVADFPENVRSKILPDG